MIGMESELLIRIGLIMKKKMMKSMFGRKDSGVWNGTMPKEQRIRTGSEI